MRRSLPTRLPATVLIAERDGERCAGPILLSGFVLGFGGVELATNLLNQTSRFSLQLLSLLVLELVGPVLVSVLAMALLLPRWLERVQVAGRRAWRRSVPAAGVVGALLMLMFFVAALLGGVLITPRSEMLEQTRDVLTELQVLSSDIRFWPSGDTKIGPPDGLLMGGFRRSLDRCFIGWCRVVVVVVGLQHPRHWIRVFPQASSLDGGGFWPALSCEEGPPACGRMRPLRRFSLSL